MKNSKAILIAIFASAFAVLTVVNMSLASPKSVGENTLDMLEIMTRAFDESEGGEGPKPGFAKKTCNCWRNGDTSDFNNFMGSSWTCEYTGLPHDECTKHPGCSTGVCVSCPTLQSKYYPYSFCLSCCSRYYIAA
jgi:hypothetical protein